MNVYICIRIVLHCLLFIVNLCGLTAASFFITALRDQGDKATAGSILVVLGSIFYMLVAMGIWSELVITRCKLSKNRNETYVIPALFGFQLIGAIVSTAQAAQNWGSCEDQSLSAAMVILSWMSTLILIVYFLIIIAVSFYHYVSDENVWDATPLAYIWFPLADFPKPAVPPKDKDVNPASEASEEAARDMDRRPGGYVDLERGTSTVRLPPPPNFPPPSVPSLPTRVAQRPLSSWMPPPVDLQSKRFRFADEESETANPVTVTPNATANTTATNPNPDGNFIEIALNQDVSSSPQNNSPNDGDSHVPLWAKGMRPVKRGVGQPPFPVAAWTAGVSRTFKELNRRIDAPVSPTAFPE